MDVKVIEIDREKNRVIFSEKKVTNAGELDKRAETLVRVKVGDALEGEITGIAPFGLFVNAEGLEGLVHLSEISWDKVVNPADFHNVGDKVKVQIIGIEAVSYTHLDKQYLDTLAKLEVEKAEIGVRYQNRKAEAESMQVQGIRGMSESVVQLLAKKYPKPPGCL